MFVSSSECKYISDVQLYADYCTFADKIKILDIPPSEFAKELKSGKFDSVQMLNQLSDHYDITLCNSHDFCRSRPFTFSIKVDNSVTVSQCFIDLDYDMFKHLYSDLQYLDLDPVMRYVGYNYDIVSSDRLGVLRMFDLRRNGIETEESLKCALDEAGFNEDATNQYYVTEFNKRFNVS